MLARKCDRCSEFYDHYDRTIDNRTKGYTNGIYFINVPINESSTSFVYRKRFDLCPKCMKQLIIFMFGEEPDEEDQDVE